ncbi:hypothetical protein PLESTF_000173100 [Pleodorina starrii]|nr:hypothetical protein PLESTF_000173100 [Pleodorina starrii]
MRTSILVSTGRLTDSATGLWSRQRQRPSQPPASATAAASFLQPHPQCAPRPPRRLSFAAPLRATPDDASSGSAAGKSRPASPGPQTEAASEAPQAPRPPTGMSGSAGFGGAGGQSERAATAAAEATVAEAAATARQRPLVEQQQAPPTVSDFRTNPRVGAAAEAAAVAESEVAAAAAEAEVAVTAASAAAAHLHAASHSIDMLRTHPHEFSCEEPSTAGGTILVALDDTDDAAAAVDWVAKNLFIPGELYGLDELRVVHVVCDPRTLQWQTSLGTSASGRPIALSSLDLGLSPPAGRGTYGDVEIDLHDYVARLNKAAEKVVERRCESLRQGGIKYEVELPRLPSARSAAGIAEALLDAVRRNDATLLVVASHGPGALAEYGSVSRFCYQHSTVPLLLMPSPETQAMACTRAAPADGGAARTAAAGGGAVGSEILLVVNHLEELANVWQWVADNCTRKGDRLAIWHVAGPSASGMPSLPIAIANQMRRRGMGDVSYRTMYSATGDPQDLAEQVCQEAACNSTVKLVVLLNYSRRGLIQEALHGSIASHLSRHCPKPLLLLQLPE